jgi:hypothetical protein
MTSPRQKSGRNSPHLPRSRSIGIVLCALALTVSLEVRCGANPKIAAPAGHISGTVRRADNGEPIANAKLGLESRCGYDCVVMLGTTTTNDSGFYEFHFAANGNEFQVRAITEGYVSEAWGEAATGDYVSVAPSAEHIDFRLVRTSTVRGIVTDEQGSAVPDIEVRAIRSRYYYGGTVSLQTAKSAKTDSAGRYRLDQLTPGQYHIQAKRTVIPPSREFVYMPSMNESASNLNESAPIQADEGATIDNVDIHVYKVRTHNISATVFDGGNPLSPAYQVQLQPDTWPDDDPGPGIPQKVSESGNSIFAFSHIAPGEYLLFVSDGNHPAGHKKVTVADSDLNVDLDIKASPKMMGRIDLEGDAGEPPKYYDLVGINPPITTRVDSGRQISVKPNGEFEYMNIRPNTYFVSLEHSLMSGPIRTVQSLQMYLKSVTCNGSDYTFKPFVISAGESITDCVITARRDGGHVDGNVDITGRGLRRWTIYFILADPPMRRFRSLVQVAENDGVFHESMIPPGEYLVYAVPLNRDGFLFDVPDFFEKNMDSATRITVSPNQSLHVTLKPIM